MPLRRESKRASERDREHTTNNPPAAIAAGGGEARTWTFWVPPAWAKQWSCGMKDGSLVISHTHNPHIPEVLAQVRPPTATRAGTRDSSTACQDCSFLSFSSWRLRRPLGALDPCGPPSLILFYPLSHTHTHTHTHTLSLSLSLSLFVENIASSVCSTMALRGA